MVVLLSVGWVIVGVECSGRGAGCQGRMEWNEPALALTRASASSRAGSHDSGLSAVGWAGVACCALPRLALPPAPAICPPSGKPCPACDILAGGHPQPASGSSTASDAWRFIKLSMKCRIATKAS